MDPSSRQRVGANQIETAEPWQWRWIKTDCGRAKYADLAARKGLLARLRLLWFGLIAAIRDWPLPQRQQS
jgi:hypothetical protein